MIKVNNVTKTFDGFRALDGLTMTVEQGSIYGLVGPNGAGKSTILRHIMGVYRPDSGSILVDGQPVFENPAVKAKIAVIPDDLYYFPSASTRDMARFYRGMYPAFDGKRYEALREAFPDVDDKQPIRRLSKGMQKQSAFWLALCCNPDLLVLDEPVDGLDPVMRRQVWSLLMGDVAQRGTTVLVSSHNLRELEDVCDHVGIMNGGKILLEHAALPHRSSGQRGQDADRISGAGDAQAAGGPGPAPCHPGGPHPHPDRPGQLRRHQKPARRVPAHPDGGPASDAGGDFYL